MQTTEEAIEFIKQYKMDKMIFNFELGIIFNISANHVGSLLRRERNLTIRQLTLFINHLNNENEETYIFKTLLYRQSSPHMKKITGINEKQVIVYIVRS